VSCGCRATKVTLPSKTVLLGEEIQRVAVLPFGGADKLTDIATSAFVAQLRNGQVYEVVEAPASIAPASGYADGTTGGSKIQQAQILQAGLLIDGTVGVRWDYHRLGAGIVIGDPTIEVSMEVKVVDVASGQVLVTEQASRSYKGEFESNSKSDFSLRSVQARLVKKCADEIAAKINGDDGTVQVELAEPSYGKASGSVRDGIESAESGSWTVAKMHFEMALKEDPQSHEMMYNLGVAHEALGNFSEANRLYLAAAQLQEKDTYRDAARRVAGAEHKVQLAMIRKHERLASSLTRPYHRLPERTAGVLRRLPSLY